MRTSLNIPEELLQEAKELTNTKTMTQAVMIALTELIQRHKSKRVLELKGSLKKGFDYKANRKKR